MGIIGDKERMEAATIADTVNTAARLESLTKHYGTTLILSENSKDQLENPDQFNFRYLGKVQVKGKKEPVGLYECFDGDPAELASLKTQSQAEFDRGLALFFDREFAEAANCFNKVYKVNQADKTAHLFMTKSSEYLLQGVPEDWTGVEVMRVK